MLQEDMDSEGHSYPCPFCSRGFATFSEVDLHMKSHAKDKLDNCSQHELKSPDKTLVEENLINETQGNHGESQKDKSEQNNSYSYPCSLCRCECRTLMELNLHMKTHDADTLYKCATCGFVSGQLCEVQSHMKTHTPVQSNPCTNQGAKRESRSSTNLASSTINKQSEIVASSAIAIKCKSISEWRNVDDEQTSLLGLSTEQWFTTAAINNALMCTSQEETERGDEVLTQAFTNGSQNFKHTDAHQPLGSNRSKLYRKCTGPIRQSTSVDSGHDKSVNVKSASVESRSVHCGQGFQRRETLTAHSQRHDAHRRLGSTRPKLYRKCTSSIGRSSPVDVGHEIQKEVPTCSHCDKTCGETCALGESDSEGNIRSTSYEAYYKESRTYSGGRMYKCTQCDFLSTQLSFIQMHLTRHTDVETDLTGPRHDSTIQIYQRLVQLGDPPCYDKEQTVEASFVEDHPAVTLEGDIPMQPIVLQPQTSNPSSDHNVKAPPEPVEQIETKPSVDLLMHNLLKKEAEIIDYCCCDEAESTPKVQTVITEQIADMVEDYSSYMDGINYSGCELCVKGFLESIALQEHLEKHLEEHVLACTGDGNSTCINEVIDTGSYQFKPSGWAKQESDASQLKEHRMANTRGKPDDSSMHSNTCLPPPPRSPEPLQPSVQNNIGQSPEEPHQPSPIRIGVGNNPNLPTLVKSSIEESHQASCEKTSSLQSQLRKHMFIHVQQESHQCAVCGKSFITPYTLRRNMTTHTEGMPYMCSNCGKQFRQAGNLKTHMLINVGEKPHKCSVCKEGFVTASLLRTHMRTHKEKPYTCSDCDKQFILAGSLKKHMRTHTGEKPYTCSDCGKQFTHARNLKLHMMNHTGERPYMCSDCGKQFTQACNLKTHMTIHTREKPYTCVDCGKQFKWASSFKKHMMTHTGEKPYTCSDCGKQFICASNFKTHMMNHTGEKPYMCSDCGKQFTQACNLKTHMVIHTRKKPYTCSDCGKQFTWGRDFKTHMVTHIGEKPYTCSDCGQRFTQAGHYKYTHEDPHR